jgi:hypothetical protein
MNTEMAEIGPESERNRGLVDCLQLFLDHAGDSQFIVVEDPAHHDRYVQFKRRNGAVYGEVGSREWSSDPSQDQPIAGESRARLAALGFTGGRRRHNYGRDELAQSAPYLGELTLELFEAAYGGPPPVSLSLKSNVPALEGLVELIEPTTWSRAATSSGTHDDNPWTAPVKASAGVRLRVERALRSNLSVIGTTSEELVEIRAAVEAAQTWEHLPGWVRAWIEKAEEGPLWVPLRSDAGGQSTTAGLSDDRT